MEELGSSRRWRTSFLEVLGVADMMRSQLTVSAPSQPCSLTQKGTSSKIVNNILEWYHLEMISTFPKCDLTGHQQEAKSDTPNE